MTNQESISYLQEDKPAREMLFVLFFKMGEELCKIRYDVHHYRIIVCFIIVLSLIDLVLRRLVSGHDV